MVGKKAYAVMENHTKIGEILVIFVDEKISTIYSHSKSGKLLRHQGNQRAV